MSRLLKSTLATAALFGAVAMPHAALAVGAQGTANATVAAALSVSEATQMSFGLFTSGNTIGTIDTDESTSGGVTYFSGATPGVFDISGSADATVSTSVNQSSISLTGPGPDMTATISTADATVTLDGSGDGTMTVDGSLAVNADQPAGAYQGTYNVTVNY